MEIYQIFRIKTYVDGNGLSEEIGQMSKIREKINIKNSVLDYIRHKQLNWYGRTNDGPRKAP